MKKLLVLATLKVCILAQPSHAETPSAKNEIDLSMAAYRIQSGYNPGFSLGTRGSGVQYGHFLNEWFELSTKFSLDVYSNTDQTPGNTRLNVTAGPTFNFPAGTDGAASAFFITLGVGLDYAHINALSIPDTNYTTEPVSNTDFAYNMEFGKRFALVPTLSWKPSVLVSGYVGTDLFRGNQVSHPALRIVPLRFAVHF